MHPTWLLLDTACPRAFVALTRGGDVLEECYLAEYQKHGEKLPEMVLDCLEKAKVTFLDLDAIAVGVGPGSFIGVRIAMSYAKGLALALNIPLVGFNTLAGIDAQGFEQVALDARRGEFYVWVVGSKQEPRLEKNCPQKTHVESRGPVASCVLSLIAHHEIASIRNQVLDLVPNYVRGSQ